jgi:hypothetical protein
MIAFIQINDEQPVMAPAIVVAVRPEMPAVEDNYFL